MKKSLTISERKCYHEQRYSYLHKSIPNKGDLSNIFAAVSINSPAGLTVAIYLTLF